MYMTVVINVLHFCFELRALKMASRMKQQVFNQWYLTKLSHIECASSFIQHNVNIMTYRLSAENAPNAHERGCAALNELLFSQQRAETRQLNSKNSQRFIIIVFSL